MNPEILKHSSARGYTRRLAALFFILCASLPAVQAKGRKPHTSAAVKVIASMSFNNKPAADMLIQQLNGKPYLFVQMANAQEVAIVDISNPGKLKLVGSLSAPDATGTNQFSINGNAATMIAAADHPGNPVNSSVGKGELVLWDVSEPGNPRVVQRFPGVVRVLSDERNYTYVLNQDGLSVVYDKQSQQNQATTDDNNWH